MLPAFIILAFCTTNLINAAKLPDTFERCKRKDPKLNECLKSAVQKAMKDLKPGVPSLQLLPIDPMDITKVVIQQGAGRPVNMKLNFSNIKFTGLSTSIIDNVKADLDKRTIYLDGTQPTAILEGDYEMDGQFLVLPIKGKGKCRLEFTGVKAKGSIQGEEVKKDGKSYWNIVNPNFEVVNLEKFHVDFGNLFNGDKALGENTNKVLNENWKSFWEELKPSIEETFKNVLLQISHTIFSKVPEDDIFLN